MPNQIDQIERAVASTSTEVLEAELQAVERRADFLRAALVFKRAANTTEIASQLFPASEESGEPSENGKRPSKRQAVLKLLGETPNRSTKAAEIKAKLVQREWLDDTPEAAHSLGVTLSKMFKRGELSRPKPGFYKITELGQARAEP